MADSDLEALLTAKSEALEVEYKAWLDTSQPEARAKIARHLAALANHGGGYLIFGIDDTTKEPQGPTSLAAELFGEDAISSIIKRYLDPRFQCRIEHVAHKGVAYPVVIVPSHGARPVIAIADGPQDAKKQPVGIREGTIYFRSAGPESIAIKRPDEWSALLERCLAHRADLLASIMRQTMGTSSRPSSRAIDLLKAACNATGASFASQLQEVLAVVEDKEKPRMLHMAEHFALFGYGLLGDNGELLSIDNAKGLNARADVGMHEYAYFGWNAFLPLHVPERAPQFRVEPLLGEERSYLEGMRLANSVLLPAAFDYWRIYEDGLCCWAESYREDGRWPIQSPMLRIGLCLVKFHSLLAHARLVGQEMPSVARVVVYADWKGLKGRALHWDEHRIVSPARLADDRFVKTITLDWRELRDDYFAALRRISLPFFNLFTIVGWQDPEGWLTRQLVERELAAMDARMRLFEP
jgi:hypothetical protein